MSDADYRRALDAAVREYERALGERAALDARLSQLQHTISTLSRLCGLQPTVPWGLTDACRAVLRNATAPLTPVEVRDRLRAIGFDLDRYANPLAAIHTVLKRLAAAGDDVTGRRRDDRRTAPPAGAAPPSPAVRRRPRPTKARPG